MAFLHGLRCTCAGVLCVFFFLLNADQRSRLLLIVAISLDDTHAFAKGAFVCVGGARFTCVCEHTHSVALHVLTHRGSNHFDMPA